MIFLFLTIPFILLSLVSRKYLINKFSYSNKLIFYQFSIVLIISLSILCGTFFMLSDGLVFNNSGIGNILALANLLYFLISHPRIQKDSNGKYSLKQS